MKFTFEEKLAAVKLFKEKGIPFSLRPTVRTYAPIRLSLSRNGWFITNSVRLLDSHTQKFVKTD